MKNYIILINKQRKPVAIEAPEKPESCSHDISNSCYCGIARMDYEQALQSAIDDESRHIHFKDVIQAQKIIKDNYYSDKDVMNLYHPQTFQIPKGWSLRFESEPLYSQADIERGVVPMGEPMSQILAILEKTSERVEKKNPKLEEIRKRIPQSVKDEVDKMFVENSAHSFTEGSEECISRYSGGSMSPSKPTAVAEPVKEVTQDQAHMALLLRISELESEVQRLEEQLKSAYKIIEMYAERLEAQGRTHL